MPNKARAPYNFVPFSNRILTRYASEDELPRHDRIDPELKSGEIHVTMIADTPVFVSDGNKHFYRTPDNTSAIPGSTVRGLVRENMQILGFGRVRAGEDLDDYQIFFREMAAARGSTGNDLKQYYHDVLDVQSRKSPSGKTYSIPENVLCGYLCRKGNSYFIKPTNGKYLRISRSHPFFKEVGQDAARTMKVSYTSNGDAIKDIKRGNISGMMQGTLLFTGRPVGRIPNHLYVFPEADSNAEPVPISETDEISYKQDWEARQNSLKAYYDVNFWALPKEGEEKPVFYIRHEEHTYFGMSLFLRIGYRHSMAEGLPDKHKEKAGGELDYPHAILGFADKDRAFRSRVSFEDFRLISETKESNEIKTVLGEPKPSWYTGYVTDAKNYTDDDFKLRGYKQYWLHEAEAAKPPEGKEDAAFLSTLRPLPEESKFSGVIRYKNLNEDELGLLLWTLRLDDGCYQSLGMGKPYGFGRMRVEIDSLREYDFAKLYSLDSLNGLSYQEGKEKVGTYISAYEAFAEQKFFGEVDNSGKKKKNRTIRGQANIQDFFFLHREIRRKEDVSYMDLKEYQNITAPLETIKDVRESQTQEEKTDEPDLSKMTPMQRALYEAQRKKKGG